MSSLQTGPAGMTVSSPSGATGMIVFCQAVVTGDEKTHIYTTHRLYEQFLLPGLPGMTVSSPAGVRGDDKTHIYTSPRIYKQFLLPGLPGMIGSSPEAAPVMTGLSFVEVTEIEIIFSLNWSGKQTGFTPAGVSGNYTILFFHGA
jgi:hypothetical protein